MNKVTRAILFVVILAAVAVSINFNVYYWQKEHREDAKSVPWKLEDSKSDEALGKTDIPTYQRMVSPDGMVFMMDVKFGKSVTSSDLEIFENINSVRATMSKTPERVHALVENLFQIPDVVHVIVTSHDVYIRARAGSAWTNLINNVPPVVNHWLETNTKKE